MQSEIKQLIYEIESINYQNAQLKKENDDFRNYKVQYQQSISEIDHLKHLLKDKSDEIEN